MTKEFDGIIRSGETTLSPDDRAHLVSEINSQTNNRPLFYLKFCAKAQFAQDICDGNLYGNTAEFFRQQEIKSGKRGQGDRFETILSIRTENITVVDGETGQVMLTAPKGTMAVQFGVDKLIPIVSFVGIPFEQMNIIEADETHTSFTLPFTEEEYTYMATQFGKYCVVISGKELESKIWNFCNSNGYDHIFDKVEYCDQNRLDRIEVFKSGAKERFLYKNSDLAYQREYRLAIGIEIPEDHFIRIGRLTSSACIESEKLKDLVFTVNYKTVAAG